MGVLCLWYSPRLLVFHQPGVLQVLDSTTLDVVVFIHHWVHGNLTDLTPSLARCMLNVALSTSLGVHCAAGVSPTRCATNVLDSTTQGVVVFINCWVYGDVTDLTPSLRIRPQVVHNVTRFPRGSFCTTRVLRQNCDVHLGGKNVLVSHVIC